MCVGRTENMSVGPAACQVLNNHEWPVAAVWASTGLDSPTSIRDTYSLLRPSLLRTPSLLVFCFQTVDPHEAVSTAKRHIGS